MQTWRSQEPVDHHTGCLCATASALAEQRQWLRSYLRAYKKIWVSSRKCIYQVVVAHAFNNSTQETEAEGSLRVRGQFDLQRELQDSQGSETEKACFEHPKIF